MMEKFTAFWDYQKKKSGEIVIAEEELQQMLNAAWDAGYNQGRAGIFHWFRPLQVQIHIHPISVDVD